MTRISNDFKKMSRKTKITIYSLILFCLGIIIVGIKSTVAYYVDNETPFSMLAAQVGDFGEKYSDINMVIWKQSETNNSTYLKTFGIPSYGYKFIENKTKCFDPSNKDTTITCNNSSIGDCHYTYDGTSHEITLSSNKRVVCNFYFDVEKTSDIDTFIYIQNDLVTDRTYENVSYQLTTDIPTNGYTYYTSNCEQSTGSVTVTSNQITVSSTTKNRCYVYYKKN